MTPSVAQNRKSSACGTLSAGLPGVHKLVAPDQPHHPAPAEKEADDVGERVPAQIETDADLPTEQRSRAGAAPPGRYWGIGWLPRSRATTFDS